MKKVLTLTLKRPPPRGKTTLKKLSLIRVNLITENPVIFLNTPLAALYLSLSFNDLVTFKYIFEVKNFWNDSYLLS